MLTTAISGAWLLDSHGMRHASRPWSRQWQLHAKRSVQNQPYFLTENNREKLDSRAKIMASNLARKLEAGSANLICGSGKGTIHLSGTGSRLLRAELRQHSQTADPTDQHAVFEVGTTVKMHECSQQISTHCLKLATI